MDVQDVIFDDVKKKLGFVPNLIREMAVNPAVARVYLEGQGAITGVLSPRERQAVQLAVSVYDECDYCRAAHGLRQPNGRSLGPELNEIVAIIGRKTISNYVAHTPVDAAFRA